AGLFRRARGPRAVRPGPPQRAPVLADPPSRGRDPRIRAGSGQGCSAPARSARRRQSPLLSNAPRLRAPPVAGKARSSPMLRACALRPSRAQPAPPSFGENLAGIQEILRIERVLDAPLALDAAGGRAGGRERARGQAP